MSYIRREHQRGRHSPRSSTIRTSRVRLAGVRLGDAASHAADRVARCRRREAFERASGRSNQSRSGRRPPASRPGSDGAASSGSRIRRSSPTTARSGAALPSSVAMRTEYGANSSSCACILALAAVAPEVPPLVCAARSLSQPIAAMSSRSGRAANTRRNPSSSAVRCSDASSTTASGRVDVEAPQLQ